VHLADLVDLAGELEDALGGGGLARIHVGEDADVPVLAEVGHGSMPCVTVWRKHPHSCISSVAAVPNG
jgi:hypothetical protein